MTVIGYPQPGKAKSRNVLQAFCAGAGGAVVDHAKTVDAGAAAAFFGVVGIEHLLRMAESGTWYYGDNAFFDSCRGDFFRFGRNCVQLSEPVAPDHDRRRAQGIEVKPWTKNGAHIVIVEQSEHFLELVGEKHWLLRVLGELKQVTDRPLRIRRWRRDKDKASRGLPEDLRGAWALVTHMSAAANEALLYGVPVFVSGRCAAAAMASGPLSNIESPRYPDGREDWAAGLAARQWTLDEMRTGMAWRLLSA